MGRPVTELQHTTGIARHGRLKRSHAVTGVLSAVALGLAVLLVSGGAVTAFALWQFRSAVVANSIDIDGPAADADPAPGIGSYENGFNLLIVGVDNDSAQGATYGVRETTLNDVNILVHVSADHSTAVVVSIPRDLVVAHPECIDSATGAVVGELAAAPVNEAMGRGGLPCVVSTVEELTGLEIPYAGLTSFAGVVRLSDAVGGVPICLSEPVDDPKAGLSLPAGTSVVSGDTALAFLRSRYGVGDGSDLARISSQQLYLASLMRTVRGDGTLTDLPRLYALANAAAGNISLSTSLAHTDTMVSMALALADIDLDRLVFVQYPGTTEDPAFPGKVVPLQGLADTMFAKIAADEPFTLGAAPPTDEPLVLGPPAETPEAPGETDAAAPPATPTPTPVALDGLTGRTADDESCAEVNGG
ncbi:LytR family transcriptional regulator [Cryobacterium sp. LW097]|nr:LytR family transcriptional regulator [Cryobacterium sp. LW097]TFC58198.1 LytR family transcriptional regulator [Cryobacterium sp. TMB1-7]TFC59692.1 LytR family transcriptional regulator [Cryobacterium sp. TMB3-1-2]TFC68161.1 LytR family transcriptional regulator [Cryobacterium sp. TMB3-15]TFC79279.1 LytR family transcriptional regulator [Cryobacterium sp. TMB3-10]TFD40179.1 LytR family transcriptional regulator [Cryobacterium sp. TMB3-12]